MPVDEASARLLHGRLIQMAEAAAERGEVIIGQALIPEQQNLMVEPPGVECRKDIVVDRAQVDALDFSAERGAAWNDAHRAGGCLNRRLLTLWERAHVLAP